MKVALERINQDYLFKVTNSNGHSVLLDNKSKKEGEVAGISPMELLLMGLAGCSSIDVVAILNKQKLNPTSLKMEVEGERNETEIPSLFNKIYVKVIVEGEISPEKIRRAVQLSFDKYCSVSKTLEHTAEINYLIFLNGKKNMKKHFETEAIRTQIERTQYTEHSSPLFLTSSFVFDDAEQMQASFAGENDKNIYSRFSNPNNKELVDKICVMEEAEAGVAFASGMAAVYTSFAALLKSGDHIVSARSIFGSTHSLFTNVFPKWNIETSYFSVDKPEGIEDIIQSNTKVIYAETPTNPGVDILDLAFLGAVAKKHNLILIIDNCFATPYLQQPIKYGADLVIHSATKLIDGQGRVLGGLIVGKEDLIAEIHAFYKNTGSALSPFNAWILSKSLETLAVRVDRHCENALTLALHLEKHPKISAVKYPFLRSHPQYSIAKKQMRHGGNIVTFQLDGGLEAGQAFLNKIEMCSLTANLGDSRTIVSHPATTTHSKLSPEDRLEVGITDGLVRLSIGLENIKDIIADIDQALDKI